jgi:hypothetical protein
MNPSQVELRKIDARRTKFTPDEDVRIRFLVERLGTQSWREIARFLPGHSARQCRNRYQNFLLDSLPTNRWTPEEDSIVTQKSHRIGPKWVEIAGLLDGRTGNDVKNRWNYHLCKVDNGIPPLWEAPLERIPLPEPILKRIPLPVPILKAIPPPLARGT